LKNAYSRWVILIGEVGQAELVVGVQPGFISRSVRAQLLVSVWYQ